VVEAILAQSLTLQIDEAVHATAHEYGESYGFTMQLLARRNSIEVIADMLGLSPDHGAGVEIITAIGAYFSARGYIPPQAYEHTQKGENRVNKITKEQYLQGRLDGKTKMLIASEHGMGDSSLHYHLKRWGVQTAADEQAAMREFAGIKVYPPADKPSPGVQALLADLQDAANGNGPRTTPETDPAPAVILDVHVTKEQAPAITLTIPIGDAPDCDEAYADLNRAQLMRLSTRMLRTALARVAEDARDLLGTEDVTAVVEAFAIRNMA